ncbi:unnamed protein product [Enterobius vermicularis]|uniref:Ovule protein n=1 Tax=Enterobius vermicularis TaxID=51028 RepID=A0A0N4UU09_ENTVE|nr:unnamed protein product [Enterobius vermicularis]
MKAFEPAVLYGLTPNIQTTYSPVQVPIRDGNSDLNANSYSNYSTSFPGFTNATTTLQGAQLTSVENPSSSFISNAPLQSTFMCTRYDPPRVGSNFHLPENPVYCQNISYSTQLVEDTMPFDSNTYTVGS